MEPKSNRSSNPHQPRLAWVAADDSKSTNKRMVPRIKITREDLIERISVVSVRHGEETWNDGQPGCSGINQVPSHQDEIKDATIDDQETPNEKMEDPLETAWTDLIERVSVAGWKEAFDEKILWIRGSYRIILVILSVVCVYYVAGSVSSFVRSGYIDQINDFVMNESLPFPNVTICAQLYFNQSFLQENLTIPNRTMQVLRHLHVSMDEFYRQLALFLTPTMRPRNFSAMNLTLFSKVIAANPQTEDYSSFSTDAFLRCESILQRCWFDGHEFDCCSKTITSFDDDGICFQLSLNMDYDNAYPNQRTFRQTTPGPDGGLIVEASVNTRDFPWLEEDAQNGFRVLVGHTPIVVFDSPVVAPHGAETFIKVVPEKRVLATKCVGKNQLKIPFENDLGYYYDPEGVTCAGHILQDVYLKYASCQMAAYMHRPNRTIVCPPIAVYAANAYATAEYFQKYTEFLATNSVVDLKKITEKVTENIEESAKGMFSNRAMCPKHCQRWIYMSSTSFFYLENDKTEDDGRMYSKLRIYFASLDYRQHEEVKGSSFYLASCDLDNVVGLYWGMSIVSFFHVIYYVPRYCYVRRRHRRIQDITTVAAGNTLVKETNV